MNASWQRVYNDKKMEPIEHERIQCACAVLECHMWPV